MGSLVIFTRLAKRTGLSKRTIKNLLKTGWTYHEELDSFPYFLHPAARMEDKRGA